MNHQALQTNMNSINSSYNKSPCALQPAHWVCMPTVFWPYQIIKTIFFKLSGKFFKKWNLLKTYAKKLNL